MAGQRQPEIHYYFVVLDSYDSLLFPSRFSFPPCDGDDDEDEVI